MLRSTIFPSSTRLPFAPEPRLLAGQPATVARDWIPEALAVLAVIALSSVSLIGQLGVLFFIAGTGALIAWQPLFNLRQLFRFWPLLLLPLLAIASTMWSDAPQRTMRAALQLLLTIAATIVVCRNLSAERLILALFVSFLLMILTVLPGVPSSYAGGYPLLVWWGSKNTVAFVGYMLFALSLGVIVDGKQAWPFRLTGLAAIGLALPVMYLAQSGGGTASLAITVLVFPCLSALGLFKLPIRLAIIAFTLLIVLVSSFFLDDLEQAVTNFRTGVLNKDATLTGRTYLWEFADRFSASRPWLGSGYYSFWRQGNIDAEGLWRWGGIASRDGFNFHNAFIEMRVDMGWIGMTLLAVTCVIVLLVALARQVVAPSVALACLVGLTTVNYFRSYVETGLVAPFSLVTLTWLATVLYAIPLRRDERTTSGRHVSNTPPEPDPIAPRREGWRAVEPGRWGGRRTRAGIEGVLGIRGEPGL